jgi:hypothetical protein
MSRSNRIWSAIGIAAWIITTPFHADAFRVVRQQSGNVIVWDNDYLDRRFGRTWRPGESASGSRRRSAGPEVISVPEPRRNEVQPNHSLLTGISRTTTARCAAALRIAETGRRALQQKQYRRAVYYLEKALSLDANPLIYFYLARSHYQLADYQGSMGFLKVAESRFYGAPEWSSEIAALRSALFAYHDDGESIKKRNASWTFNR